MRATGIPPFWIILAACGAAVKGKSPAVHSLTGRDCPFAVNRSGSAAYIWKERALPAEACGPAPRRKKGRTAMNLRVRIKNPVFWVQIVLGAVATALAYAGLTAADLTSWPALWDVVKNTFTNPYCLFLVASNVWAALNDPTTSGLSDSDRAKTYDKPLEK